MQQIITIGKQMSEKCLSRASQAILRNLLIQRVTKTAGILANDKNTFYGNNKETSRALAALTLGNRKTFGGENTERNINKEHREYRYFRLGGTNVSWYRYVGTVPLPYLQNHR